MQIHFERSGGFAGMKLQHDVDSASLSPDQAQQLSQLLESAQFFKLPQTLQATSPGADRFKYKISVNDGGQSHSVELDDGTAPEQVKPLLRWLTAAQKQK